MKLTSNNQKQEFQLEINRLINNLIVPHEFNLSSFAYSQNQISTHFRNSVKDNNPPKTYTSTSSVTHPFQIKPFQEQQIKIINSHPKTDDSFSKIQYSIEEQNNYSGYGQDSLQIYTSQNLIVQSNKNTKMNNISCNEKNYAIPDNKIILKFDSKNDEKKQNKQNKPLRQITNKNNVIRQKENKQRSFSSKSSLIDQIELLKDDLDRKNKEIISKNLQIKKQKEKYEAIIARLNIYQSQCEQYQHKLANLEVQVIEKNNFIKKIKEENRIISQKNDHLNEQFQRLQEQLSRQQHQKNNIKLINKQLSQKLKLQAMKNQQIQNSMYSNNSIIDSFSPEMLSPQQTIQIMYEIFKKVSRSNSMMNILYSNKGFMTLISKFYEEDKLKKRLIAIEI